MTHPQLVTIDKKSAPRVAFSGDKLVFVDLPEGSRVLYPKPPMAELRDVDAAIRHAITHPENCEPLFAKLRPGMRVVIAIDDLSMPLPPMRRPDVRERVLTVVLDLLAQYGVDDIEMIIATAFHRRMKADEIRHIVGDKIFGAYYPDRLHNHDAEEHSNLIELGTTDQGEVVEINKRAATADLLIYVNLTFVPMNGGHKSVVTGLSGYKSLKQHHNPRTTREGNYMDPANSGLANKFARMGKIVDDAVDVFHIETTINNRMFDRPLDFLAKNEDTLSASERAALKGLVFSLDKMPQALRGAVFDKVPAPYGLIGVWAGETEATHAKIIERAYEQALVPVRGQADILVSGIPHISPYNVHAYLNPLLVQVMAQGYLFNLTRGAPMVKKGGTMIIFHPCSDRFDKEQHGSYIEFFHQLLPETRDAMDLHKRYEAKFAANPAHVQAYRTGHAYHPAHPFYMWYWGEPGRQHMGRVIVVGADNEYVPKLLGYETAKTFAEALEMAKSTAPSSPEILMMHTAPMLMADMTV